MVISFAGSKLFVDWKCGVRFVICDTYTREVLWRSMPSRETNTNFTNGVPELLILRLLKEEELYGYQIVQVIRDRTESVIAFGEGVIYPILYRLESDGALTARRKTVNGRSRIYYSATPAGSIRLADMSRTWANLTAAIQTMLSGGQDGEAIPRTG